MKIDKKELRTFWYEDAEGNILPDDPNEPNGPVEGPEGAEYYVTRWPLVVRESHNRIIKQEDVDKCKHKRRWIKRTYGWIEGIKGRECTHCHGYQVRNKRQAWGRNWNAKGSIEVFVGSSHINSGEKTILAMANSGDFTLKEAILAYSMACERCMNVLEHKYTNGEDGYPEYSEEWKKCNTVCLFCENEEKFNSANRTITKECIEKEE